MPTCDIEFYTTDAGNAPVEKYLDELPEKDAEEISAALRQFALYKTDSVVESKPIHPPLYELKIKQHRLLYAEFDGVVVLFHAFLKKSRKTPIKEIDAATRRLKIEQRRRR